MCEIAEINKMNHRHAVFFNENDGSLGDLDG